MNRVKSIVILLLAAVMLSVLPVACGGEESEATPRPTAAPTATDAGDEATEVSTPKEPATGKTTEPDPTKDSEDGGTVPAATAVDVGGESSGLTAEIVSGEFAGAGKPFTFDGTQSQAGELPIEAYEWDMGDGTFLFGLAVQHAYKEPGDYTVTLTIIDEDGERSSTSKVVMVIPLADLLTPTAVSEDPTVALIGTYWLMNNPMRGTIITLNFDEDELSGSSGCNSFSAGYDVTPNDGPTTTIIVGVISGTSQTCTPEIMAQERGFLDSLASAKHYSIEENTLILETGSGTLTFRPADQ